MFTLSFVLFPFLFILFYNIITIIFFLLASVFSQVFSLLLFSLFINSSIQNVQETKVNPQL